MKFNLLIIVGLATLLGLCSAQKGHFWGGDFAMYLHQAKAFTEGNISDLHEQNVISMNRSENVIGPNLYPMGYPILISSLLHIIGNHFMILKMFNILFFVGSTLFLYLILRQFSIPVWIQNGTLLMYASNYQLVFFLDRICSEFAFIFFCYISLYLIGKHRKNNFHHVILGILFFASAITRTTGILLLPTLFVYQCFSGTFKTFLTKPKQAIHSIIPYLVFLILILIYNSRVPAFDSVYVKIFTFAELDILHQLKFYFSNAVEMFLYMGKGSNIFIALFGLILIPIITLGSCLLFRKDNIHLYFFCGSLFALHVAYPLNSIRFNLPLTPFILLSFLYAVHYIFIKYIPSTKHNYSKILIAIFAGLSLAQCLAMISIQKIKGTNEAYTEEMQAVYSYLKATIPRDELVLFRKPRVLRYFTGINAIQTSNPENAEYHDIKHILTTENLNNKYFLLKKSWTKHKLYERMRYE